MVSKNHHWLLFKPVRVLLNSEDEDCISDIYRKGTASGNGYINKLIWFFSDIGLMDTYIPPKYKTVRRIKLTEKGKKLKGYFRSIVNVLGK